MRVTATLRAAFFVLLSATLASCGSDSDSSSDSDPGPVESTVTFTDVSEEFLGFARDFGEEYAGIGWFDYDRDDDLDVIFPNAIGAPAMLLSNDGDGTFTDVSVASGVASITSGGSGVAIGDIDNDGYPDVFISGSGGFVGPFQSQTVLLHNQPDGSGGRMFVDIANSAMVPGDETALSAAFGDINNDGYVDLFVTGEGHLGFSDGMPEQHEDRLYLNNGDLTFTDITDSAGVAGGEGSCVVSFSHFDDDEYIDLFVGVCNDVFLLPTPWYVYRNNGDNTFTDVAPTTQLDKGGFWMSSTFGDIDNDGDFDLFATNLGFSSTHHLWRNNGDGTYVDIAENEMAVSRWSWGATFADFDNDTWQDLYYGGELPGRGSFGKGGTGYLFFNDGGNGRFTFANDLLGFDAAGLGVTGIAKADYDGDGFVDISIMSSPIDGELNEAVLLRNDGNGNRSLTIRLEGTNANRMGIGARIEVITPEGVFQAREIWAGSSFVSSESQWPVFGLGKETVADAIVYWPGGDAESFPNLDAGELHHLVEGEGEPLP